MNQLVRSWTAHVVSALIAFQPIENPSYNGCGVSQGTHDWCNL
jgi:hypothetical protein